MKWEYKVVKLSTLKSINMSDSLIRLVALGDDGWEVCAVDGNTYLLKRLKQ